ncbi:RNA processing protein [Dissophora globulifera]|nr:RNA processing protein [Dissophora globulifera]
MFAFVLVEHVADPPNSKDQTLVELKNGETFNGHLVNCDNWMNLTLREVIQTSSIKYLRVPDEIIDMVKEEANKQRLAGGRNSSRGGAGGGDQHQQQQQRGGHHSHQGGERGGRGGARGGRGDYNKSGRGGYNNDRGGGRGGGMRGGRGRGASQA